MPLKFNQFSHSSASADQPQPPFGAPTGHFGDQTDNIQREAMAATKDLGEAVFGQDLDQGAHAPGDMPLLQGTGDVPGNDINQLKSQFAQMIYDMTWRKLIDVRAINSTVGLTPTQVNAALIPDGVTATWQRCDGTNGTPDLRGKVIYGAADGENTGDAIAAGKTSADSAGPTDGHELDLTQITRHSHGDGSYAVGTAISGEKKFLETFTLSPSNEWVANSGNGQPVVDVALGNAPTLTLTNGNVTGASGNTGGNAGQSAGDVEPHLHEITGTHDHDTGTPPGVALEYWMRTA